MVEVGTVKWWNNPKGYGYIITKQGAEVFVHHTSLIMEGFRTLSQGQRVRFEVVEEPAGLRARHVVPLGKGEAEDLEEAHYPEAGGTEMSINSGRARVGHGGWSAPEVIGSQAEFDVFICHASEDKETFVESLARRLAERHLRVWYDSFRLKLGDRLRSAIDDGLSRSRFGIVVLSPNFCRKEWPKRELEGLLALERGGRKVILPLWHGVNHDDVARFSPILADRVALTSNSPLERIVEEILEVVHE